MQAQSITVLKGIGKKREELFEKAGIFTLSDLLYYFPSDYQDFSSVLPVSAATHGRQCVMHLTVLSAPSIARFSGMTVVSCMCSDGIGKIRVKWFNQPYRMTSVSAGDSLYFSGRIDKRRECILQNPAISTVLPGIVPRYTLPKDLKQKFFRDTVAQVLPLTRELYDHIPQDLLKTYDLPSLQEAIRLAHQPGCMNDVIRAKRRLSFENALYYLLSVSDRKQQRLRHHGIMFLTDGTLGEYLRKLSFQPTGAQLRVMQEIASDMARPVPMNRLVQGDVGSGKTAVAMFAMMVAANNGYQSVLMAPTEILAGQHYRSLKAMFGDEAVFLHGGMSKREKEAVLSDILSGKARVITGTHALLYDAVHFHRLGLIITDEQHRFGVMQRSALEEKGTRPDVLVMSATPIPRTLALLLSMGTLTSRSLMNFLPDGFR